MSERLQLAALERDLHEPVVRLWMQQPHVRPWWELDGPPARTADYLARQEALAHSRSWIAHWDGVPFAYLETYRAAEDPLAAHYAARPGDRGWHVLVGPLRHLGSGVPRALGRQVVARLFAEPGAERVVCEPDIRNRRMIAFCQALGGRVAAELDLPDKRAALMMWERDEH